MRTTLSPRRRAPLPPETVLQRQGRGRRAPRPPAAELRRGERGRRRPLSPATGLRRQERGRRAPLPGPLPPESFLVPSKRPSSTNPVGLPPVKRARHGKSQKQLTLSGNPVDPEAPAKLDVAFAHAVHGHLLPSGLGESVLWQRVIDIARTLPSNYKLPGKIRSEDLCLTTFTGRAMHPGLLLC